MKILFSSFFYGNGKIGVRWIWDNNKKIFQIRFYIFLIDYALMFQTKQQKKAI